MKSRLSLIMSSIEIDEQDKKRRWTWKRRCDLDVSNNISRKRAKHCTLFEMSRQHPLFSELTPTKKPGFYTWLYLQVYKAMQSYDDVYFILKFKKWRILIRAQFQRAAKHKHLLSMKCLDKNRITNQTSICCL